MHKRLNILIGCIFLLYFHMPLPGALAGTLTAEASVDRTDPFLGEPFMLQIRVTGSETPDQPKLPDMDGFQVAFAGGTQNSSTSIQIINGRMSKEIQKGYIFSYRLTPLQKGRLTIPAIPVTAKGDTATTHSISITVREPEKTENYKLRIRLSKTGIYVGEPVILTVTWYLGSDVQNALFSFPFLQNNDQLYIADQKTDATARNDLYRVPLNDGQVIVKKGQETLDNTTYATLKFSKVLIFKKAGDVTIDPATVSFQALVGYRKENNFFDDDFFSNFFNNGFPGLQKQGIYRQFAIPSNPVSLTVHDLPAEGRPADFSGLVGNYHITASAKPLSVNVGDPITLTVELSGVPYLDPVQLPPLSKLPELASNFKIPTEQAAGEVSGDKKIFTQTLRPRNASVKEIPTISLSYFDTKDASYKTARTAAIPLMVKPTRIVTAGDAEGNNPPAASGNDLESFSGGIAHNYEDTRVLSNQIHNPVAWVKSFQGAATLAIPPILYLLFWAGSVFYRMKTADPATARAKTAFARLQKAIKSAELEESPRKAKIDLLDAVKCYLGDKLHMPAGALTFMDVVHPLARKGVDSETLETLKEFMAECEAARYGNTVDQEDSPALMNRLQMLIKKLEKIL